ncbi:L-threonine 3-dehydrogenase [Mucilaginibacter pineti]|uniref:L-threonine 3-dehydrogenase n=1 Tax=Mucilaginibacter pineti TaxID=1391627 RepID=A0A1G6Z5Z2_9SPHI|nr:NAD-dependent epimerase/dehydratase family protein [Mucilaginibacter pineti]SDD97703.1 L-threonine 3-dehydrogenase [Mucilaginibacter pineti]
MKSTTILVIGACGQIGSELTIALRKRHGNANVIAADRPAEISGEARYRQLDVLNMSMLADLVRQEQVTQIYLLAAMLSATGEQNTGAAWKLNMNGLLDVLKVASAQRLDKVFWPSSIAIFGPGSPKHLCPQDTLTEPNTVYGISKRAGEYWCNYYFEKHGLDVRSIRYPGLISYTSPLGGGTTDYAVAIFHQALEQQSYSCFLEEDTCLPMMYMPDAIRATLELMEAPAEQVKIRTSYNLSALSFSPCDLAAAIRKHIPAFEIAYRPDSRQAIAAGWPASINDVSARLDWGWEPAFDLETMVSDMLENLGAIKRERENPRNWVHDDNYFFTRIDEA